MRKLIGIMTAMAVAVVFSSTVKADDRAEMADLQARIATLEAKLMAPSGGGDAESLTSANKAGAVRIGGDLDITVRLNEYTEAGASHDEMNTTTLEREASLNVRVDSGPDTWIYLKLDLDDGNNNNSNIIEEAHFVWENVRGSGLTLILGQDEVFFGQDKNALVTDGYAHGTDTPFLAAGNTSSLNSLATPAAAFAANTSSQLFRSNSGLGMNAGLSPMIMSNNTAGYTGNTTGALWQGELDNRIGIGAQYKIRDIMLLEATLFQDSANMTEDTSQDNMAFDSYAIRATATPIEGLEIQASFMNRHNEAMSGDDDGEGTDIDEINPMAAFAMNRIMLANGTPVAYRSSFDGGTANIFETEMAPNQRSVSLSADYTTPSSKINVWGEYIHTWNAGWYDAIDTDSLDLGVTYALTEKLMVGVQGGWVHIDNEAFQDIPLANFEMDEDLYKAAIGATYTTDYGVTFLVEYMQEWYESELHGYENARRNTISFETVYSF